MSILKKRMRPEAEEMAECLMLLARHYQNAVNSANNNGPIQAEPISMYIPEAAPKELPSATRFECKTCSRSFSSFQALGDHRASHKKPRVNAGDDAKIKMAAGAGASKRHECSICGVVFSMGQALGGHMRRHRESHVSSTPPPPRAPAPPVVVLKRSNSHVKVSSINTFLDLNLTPLENDLKLLFGNMMIPTKY